MRLFLILLVFMIQPVFANVMRPGSLHLDTLRENKPNNFGGVFKMKSNLSVYPSPNKNLHIFPTDRMNIIVKLVKSRLISRKEARAAFCIPYEAHYTDCKSPVNNLVTYPLDRMDAVMNAFKNRVITYDEARAVMGLPKKKMK